MAKTDQPHIRKPMPSKGGNSFYRDKNDYAKFCGGAPITDKDIDFFTAGTKKFRASGWPVCDTCMMLRTDGWATYRGSAS